MKSLSQFILEQYIDNDVDLLLSEDLKALLLCLQKTSLDDFYFETKQSSLVFESLSQLDSFHDIYKVLRKFFQKLPNDFEEKEYVIDLKDIKTFCDEIVVDLRHSDSGNTSSYSKHSDDFNTIYVSIQMEDHRKNSYSTQLCGLILHELLHAYEDKCRAAKGKPSIFDELTSKYQAGFESLKRQDFVVRNLAVLNYFLNKKEQRAYLSTIELDILEIINKIKPSFSDMKTDKVMAELKKTGIWKTYFEFGKFVMFIDKIDDKVLEKSYYIASKTSKERHKDMVDKIEKMKANEKVDGQPYKSANAIRKECKEAWSKFNKKFESVFIKVFGEVAEV